MYLIRRGAGCLTRDIRRERLIAGFSLQFHRLSDNQDQKMSKKALILVADGTEEIEL